MPYSANKAFWKEATKLHLIPNDYYDIQGFKKGGSSLRFLEITEIGNVAGCSLLHLQCHFGLDSLSWSRLGAIVTGIDFSEVAIGYARRLAEETGLSARFICCDIYDAHIKLTEPYDIVFTSYGSVRWLHDLDAWAGIAYASLIEGGFLYIIDTHPKLLEMAAKHSCEYLVDSPYCSVAGVYPEVAFSSDYAHKNYEISSPRCIWHHKKEHIVDSIVRAGFKIEFIHEHFICEDEYLPTMVKNDLGWYYLPEKPDLPLMFSIKAVR